jgi:hypothetical protein
MPFCILYVHLLGVLAVQIVFGACSLAKSTSPLYTVSMILPFARQQENFRTQCTKL